MELQLKELNITQHITNSYYLKVRVIAHPTNNQSSNNTNGTTNTTTDTFSDVVYDMEITARISRIDSSGKVTLVWSKAMHTANITNKDLLITVVLAEGGIETAFTWTCVEFKGK